MTTTAIVPPPVPQAPPSITTQVELMDLFRSWYSAKYHTISEGAVTLVYAAAGGFLTFFSDCQPLLTEGEQKITTHVTSSGRHDVRIDYLPLSISRAVGEVRRLTDLGVCVQLVNAPARIEAACYGGGNGHLA